MDSEELVTIATFRTLAEAQVAKGALEAEGIESFLTDETTAGIYAGAIGVRLQVRSEDEEEALDILPPDEPQPEYSSDPPQEVCPKCRSSQIRFVGKKFFSADPPHWECDDCRARWVVEPDE